MFPACSLHHSPASCIPHVSLLVTRTALYLCMLHGGMPACIIARNWALLLPGASCLSCLARTSALPFPCLCTFCCFILLLNALFLNSHTRCASFSSSPGLCEAEADGVHVSVQTRLWRVHSIQAGMREGPGKTPFSPMVAHSHTYPTCMYGASCRQT